MQLGAVSGLKLSLRRLYGYPLCARVRFVSELLSGRVFLHTGDRLEYFARLNSHVDIHLLLLSLSKEVQQNRRLVLTRTARC